MPGRDANLPDWYKPGNYVKYHNHGEKDILVLASEKGKGKRLIRLDMSVSLPPYNKSHNCLCEVQPFDGDSFIIVPGKYYFDTTIDDNAPEGQISGIEFATASPDDIMLWAARQSALCVKKDKYPANFGSVMSYIVRYAEWKENHKTPTLPDYTKSKQIDVSKELLKILSDPTTNSASQISAIKELAKQKKTTSKVRKTIVLKVNNNDDNTG
jgi:hypothetical protein